MKVLTRHLIRPAHLNHHNTLYAGIINEWVSEAGFMGMATELGTTKGAVMVAIKNLSIKVPAKAGSILQLQYEAVHYGSTSVEIVVSGVDYFHPEVEHVRANIVFVTVDENGKKTPHHLNEHKGA